MVKAAVIAAGDVIVTPGVFVVQSTNAYPGRPPA
jgi:hypothetical protein